MKFKKEVRLYILLFFVCMGLFIWFIFSCEDRKGFLTVSFLDVGQGDAIFIDTPSGLQVLIDGGKNKSVLRELSSVLPFYDRSIDVVIATHPDADHIEGLVSVLENYKVDYFVESGNYLDNGIYEELVRLSESKNTERIFARRGMNLNFGESLNLSFLFPDRDVLSVGSNTASVVTKLVYGGKSFLFTGDSPKSIEKYLVSLDSEVLKSDVLQVGHHGSKTSTSDVFLNAVNPEIAVISVGVDNRYGHPSESILDLLDKFNVEFFRTDQDGLVEIKSDGYSLVFGN
ncbi:ComEC/Rec2 family competence protein [Patescibacteria group bacterium]